MPFPGVKLNWVTEITHVADRQHFIDEQRFGPYAFWHHQHHFEAVDGGVMMTDILHYKVPFGIIGTLADMLLVDNRIEQIFSYRKKAVAKVFNLEMV
jgi:ligand-binding SRPBCC domain-containing protein